MLRWAITSAISKTNKGNGSSLMTAWSIVSILPTSKANALEDPLPMRMSMIGKREKIVKVHIF